jgi:ribonuclease HI
MLDSLEKKWDPWYPQPEDVEDEIAPQPCENPDAVEFDPRIITYGTIADMFRIFTQGKECEYTYAPEISHNVILGVDEVTVYADGSAINGATNVTAGMGVFFGIGDPRNCSLRVPDELGPSNQVAEMIGIREAADIIPEVFPL